MKKNLSRFACCSSGWLISLALLLSGCQAQEDQWHGKNIRGLMPDLEFRLINVSGEEVTADDSAGQVRLLYFGFTSCPDVCPATLAQLSRSIRQLPEELQNSVTTLFVSVDPGRDSPERLASYVNFFGEGITGMTGPKPALRELAKRYRTTFGYDEPDAEGNYQVSHSAAVYVFDGEGRARLLFRPDLSASMIAEDLEALARESNS